MLVLVTLFLSFGRGIYHKILNIIVTHDINGFCCTPLIWEATHIYSDMGEGVLDCTDREVTLGLEEGFFRGGRYAVHEVLAFLKSFLSFMQKKKLTVGNILSCFLFNLLLLSYIISHHSELHLLYRGDVYY